MLSLLRGRGSPTDIISSALPANPTPGAGFLPPIYKELFSHFVAAGEPAVPLSDAVKTLTGHHTSFEEWLSKPSNKAKFE